MKPSPLGSLKWSDEFDYTGSANGKWEYQIGNSGWGNNEKQYYTDKNANAKNGFLTIVAKNENFGGSSYTSSRLMSKQTFRYGVFEMRAKLPRKYFFNLLFLTNFIFY